MNAIDRMVAFFDPEKAMRRLAARKVITVLNSGYSEGGASTQKKSMRGWRANSASPAEDIDMNLYELRNRARDLFMNSPIGGSAIKTTRTNVIGSGLRLKSRIDADFLGLSEEQAEAWEQKVEREFNLWAESKHCDALKINNFYELQQLAQLAWLQSGDVFTLFKTEKQTHYMPYSLRLHLIEADRVSTPREGMIFTGETLGVVNPDNKNPIASGVEIDKKTGAVVAYWISNRYPQSTQYLGQDMLTKWQRVEAFGSETGRPNILQLMECERPEQRRGVPFLAPVIECLKQLTRYTEAELMATVISSMFTVFIKSEGLSTEMPFGSMVPDEEQVAANDPTVYELGAGAVNVLQPGEDVEFANPGRPNQAFDGFVNALSRYIGAALEIPQELLLKAFNSSYSASRAALLEAWKMFRMRRTWMANDFCQPIYEEWLSEAVASGRIKAPGFFLDPIIQKAWCGAEWNGPAPGQIDPKKEVDAAVIRVENGFSTRDRETIELTGGDFGRNARQLKRENNILSEANKPMKKEEKMNM